jgi:hypothetical protein
MLIKKDIPQNEDPLKLLVDLKKDAPQIYRHIIALLKYLSINKAA